MNDPKEISKVIHFASEMHQHSRIVQQNGISLILIILADFIIGRDVYFDESSGMCLVRISSGKKWTQNHWIRSTELSDLVFTQIIKYIKGSYASLRFSPIQFEKVRSVLTSWLDKKHIESKTLVFSDIVLNPPRSSETGSRCWIFARQPMRTDEEKKNEIVLKSGQRAIWDQRFIIHLSPPLEPEPESSSREYLIRNLKMSDYKSIIEKLEKSKDFKGKAALEKYWAKMPPKSRETIPCVAAKETPDIAFAIPSLKINLEKSWLNFECVYSRFKPTKTISMPTRLFE
jgi:hypothetical protein